MMKFITVLNNLFTCFGCLNINGTWKGEIMSFFSVCERLKVVLKDRKSQGCYMKTQKLWQREMF